MIKVLHFSTHDENCGIGKYQEMFLEAMGHSREVKNDFFEWSPNQIKQQGQAEYDQTFKQLERELADHDLLHIQHEFSFYTRDELQRALTIAHRLGKRYAVTIHTSPNVAHKPAKLQGVGPRSLLHYVRRRRAESHFFRQFMNPLKRADMVIVHNDVTKAALVARGLEEARIRKIVIPVPRVSQTTASNLVTSALRRSPNDVIYCTVGYMHRFKGIEEAIRALAYLPAHYKLAIIGGVHPESDHVALYNDMTNLVLELGLRDRVYITGYIADDELMNAAIRECDLCVYPYDREYYANVSSAALNNAFANGRPVVAYPTASFQELNRLMPAIVTTQTFSYYELAREIGRLDTKAATAASHAFLQAYDYPSQVAGLTKLYRELAG